MHKDILHLGVEVGQQCSDCQKFANKAPRPLLRGHVATQFNELLHQDLFFLWGQPFALYIDSCTHLEDRLPPGKQAVYNIAESFDVSVDSHLGSYANPMF